MIRREGESEEKAMRLGRLSVPDPQTLLDLPAALVQAVHAIDELTSVLRDDFDSAGARGEEIRDLRRVAEGLEGELREIRTELGWLRANLESIQDRVPGLSPPGPG